MFDLLHSQLYARYEDVVVLKTEPDYVRNRYFTIIKTIMDAPFRWTRQKAAGSLHIPKRRMQHSIRAFLLFGIPDLRFKSKRLKTSLPPSSRLRLHGAHSCRILAACGFMVHLPATLQIVLRPFPPLPRPYPPPIRPLVGEPPYERWEYGGERHAGIMGAA
jgi:hypothetical protein